MTIDEAISHALEVAEQNESSAITYKNCKEIKTNMYEKLTAEKAENDCRECAADHRQLAAWLTELKEAKRLLKLALDDIQTLNDSTVDDENGCLLEDKFESYTECPLYCGSDKYCGWQYQVDALMLIGGEPNE